MEGDAAPNGVPSPVSWDEARELVAIVLLVAAVAVVAAPVVRDLGDGGSYPFWDHVRGGLRNIAPPSGMLLLASAVVVCTAPVVDVVPALRRAVVVVAGVMVVLGVVAILLDITAPTAGGSALTIRTASILARSGPGTMLAGIALWLGLRVVPFPQ